MTVHAPWKTAPDELERLWRVWAAADLVLCVEAWLRLFSFDAVWAPGQRLGKLDTGGGDRLYAVFTPAGTVLKGFAHESEVSPAARDDGTVWPGMYAGLPEPLREALNDPALEPDDVTFCFWREPEDPRWSQGFRLPLDIDDGSEDLLGYLFETPEAFAEWAEDYYERPVDTEALALLASGAAITPALVGRLNPERNAEEVLGELLELGLIDPETLGLALP